ncbi:MAG: signal peptidase I [Pseudomonadota bacterium]
MRRERWALIAVLAFGLPLAALVLGPPLFGRVMAGAGGYLIVPSDAMAPNLLPGDRVVAQARSGKPGRGAVVVYRLDESRTAGGGTAGGGTLGGAPPLRIGRVIGLPGETVAMVHGVPVIDGTAAEVVQIEDDVLEIPADRAGAPRPRCLGGPAAPGEPCRRERWRERLPGALPHVVLNFQGCLGRADGDGCSAPARADNVPPTDLGQGMLWILGDNRDNALDSRFGMVGPVAVDAVVGEVVMIHTNLGAPSRSFAWVE